MSRPNSHAHPGPDLTAGRRRADFSPEERELAMLFAALPERQPRAGFADRVLARVRRESLFARRGIRLLLAASLAAVAIAAAGLLPAAGQLAAWIGPAGLIAAITDSFADLAIRFASGLSFWEPFIVAARGLAPVFGDLRFILFLSLQFFVAAAALRGLVALAAVARGSAHVSQLSDAAS